MNSQTNTSGAPLVARIARWVVSLHLLALLVQMSAAISFVSGFAAAYLTHAKLAWIVFGLGLLQALAVLNPALPRLHKLYSLFVILVVVGEVLQLFVIPQGQLAYHVSVAMIVWGCTLALFVRLLDPEWATTAVADSG